MKYIIISGLNRNYFLFLSYFIITMIRQITSNYITTTKDIINIFHKYYIHTLSNFISIIPFIVIKIRSKGISRNSTNKLNSKRKIKLSIIVSIFEFSVAFIDIIFEIIIKNNNYVIKKADLNSSILFNIVSKYVLSVIILHSPFYRHHYLSLAINFIFLIALVILDISHIEENNQFYYALIKILKRILFSFEDVIAKILLSLDSISAYVYLLYRGIFVNIFVLLFSLIFIFVELADENGEKSCIFLRLWKVYENKLNIFLYIVRSFFII